MKTKRIKATLVKAVLNEAGGDGVEELRHEWTLPADAASYERIVKQMARGMDPEAFKMCDSFEQRMRCGDPTPWLDYRTENRNSARLALRAIGIAQPKKGTK